MRQNKNYRIPYPFMKNIKNISTIFLLCTMPLAVSLSCKEEPPRKEVVLYKQYCASCHMAPKIENLPKNIWENNVLPDMLTRMACEGSVLRAIADLGGTARTRR